MVEEFFTKPVNYELAEILNNRVWSENDKYAAEDLDVSWDNYLGHKKYMKGDYIDEYPDNIHGKFYYAPTYADVIDWLFSKGFVIEFRPAFTFSLPSKIAYYFTVYKINENTAKLEKIDILNDDEYMYSLQLLVSTTVKKLDEMKML